MGDHFVDFLNDAGRRETGMTEDPLGGEFSTLDWNSDTLPLVDQKNPCTPLNGSPGRA
jgi:hypothetical protein